MDDLACGTLKLPSNAQIGDNAGYDKSALKGYACESKLKRIFAFRRQETIDYLQSKFSIAHTLRVRPDASLGEISKVTHDDFDIIDVLKSKLTSFNSKICLKLWDIYEEKGLEATLNAIQLLSPLQRI